MKRLALTLLFCTLTAPAYAGLFGESEEQKLLALLQQQQLELQNRLNASEASDKQLQERLAQLESRLKNQRLLDLVIQLDAAHAEIAKLRGQLEVLNFNLESAQKRQRDLYVDLDNRLRPLEQNNSKPEAKAQDNSAEAQAFDAAYGLYRVGNYKNAVTAFESFGKQYPDSNRKAESLFWVGQAHTQLRDFKAASASLQQLLDGFPDHPRAAEALRGIANLQLEQGDKKAARKTLRQVLDLYPNSEAASKASQQLSTLK